MSDISLSKAVRSNLLSLQNTASMMAKTQERLSTGNKVNSALDNPTNFFTAAGLNSRASDLNQLMDGMANGIQTLEAADNGLTAITKTLESMQSTLRQARQDKSFQTSSLVMAEIDPNATDLGKLTLSGGAVGNATAIALTKTGAGGQIATTEAFAPPAAAGAATFAGGATITDAMAVAGVDFTIEFGGKSVNVKLTAHADNKIADLTDAIDDALENSDTGVTAALTSGKYVLTGPANTDGSFTVTGANTLFGATAAADPAAPTATEYVSTAGSDGKFEFTINGKKISLDTTTGANVDTAAEAINTQLGDKAKFEAYRGENGTLALRATEANAGALVIGGTDAGLFGNPAGDPAVITATPASDLTFARSVDELVSAVNTALEGKVRASNDNGKLRLENLSTEALDIEGLDANGALSGGTSSSSIAGNSVRAGLADQFNELRDQLDKLADDASFNGINLLRGDKLTITFNETGTSSIDIQTKGEEAVNSSNLGVSTTINPQDLDSDSNIDAELSKLKLALNDVRSQSSAFGSNLSIVQNRQDFTKNMINTLQTGGANLTLADMNEEAANLLALQTRQSLSSSSLSLASQADQSVLQLIR